MKNFHKFDENLTIPISLGSMLSLKCFMEHCLQNITNIYWLTRYLRFIFIKIFIKLSKFSCFFLSLEKNRRFGHFSRFLSDMQYIWLLFLYLNVLLFQFQALFRAGQLLTFQINWKTAKNIIFFTFWHRSVSLNLLQIDQNLAQSWSELSSILSNAHSFFRLELPVLYPVLSCHVSYLVTLGTKELKFWNVISPFFAPNKLKNTIGALKIPSFEVHLGSNPTSNTLVLWIDKSGESNFIHNDSFYIGYETWAVYYK